MKFAAIVTITALTGAAGQAAHKIDESANRTVTVCFGTEVDMVSSLAQLITTKAFARIGVRLDWRGDQRSCPAGAILITMVSGLPQNSRPGALAFALPFEGRHIQVIHDRVRMFHARQRPYVLANVLIHEITHILQRVDRHSDTGVMKANWSGEELGRMFWGPLPFEKLDVTLIYRGLGAKTAVPATR